MTVRARRPSRPGVPTPRTRVSGRTSHRLALAVAAGAAIVLSLALPGEPPAPDAAAPAPAGSTGPDATTTRATLPFGVSGTVRDAGPGPALARAVVTLTPVTGGPTRTRLTTDDGAFHYRALERLTYRLEVRYIGREPLVRIVSPLPGEERRRLDLTLTMEPLLVETVTVHSHALAGDARALNGVSILSSRELAAGVGPGDADPMRAIQLLPGVQAGSDFSSGLHIRGGGPDQTLVLLEGAPVYNPSHAFGFFSTFDPNAVDEVRLYKGGYPSRFGGRLGSVLDVRQRTGTNPEVEGSAGVSTIASAVSLSGPIERGSWRVNLRRTHLEPVLDELRRHHEEIPSYWFYDLSGKLELTTLPSDRLRWHGYQGRDHLKLDLEGGSAVDFAWGNRAMTADYDHAFGPHLQGRVRYVDAAYDSRSTVSIFSSAIDLENRIRDRILSVDLDWEAHSRHRIETGIELSSHAFEYRETVDGEVQAEVSSRPRSVAIYAEDEWRVDARTRLRMGLRSRLTEIGSRVLVDPRVSVARELGGNVRGRLGAGLYHQVVQLVSTEGLSAADFYLPLDDSAPASRAWQTSAGLEWTPGPGLKLSAETYHRFLDGLVEYDNARGLGTTDEDTETFFYTGGEGRAYGLELLVERRRGRLTGWLSYTLAETRRRFDELNDGEWYSAKHDRRHDLNLTTQLDLGAYHPGATFVYGTGQAFTPAAARYLIRNPATGELTEGEQLLPAPRNSGRLAPYHRLDLGIDRDVAWLGDGGQIYVKVFNVYSRRNDWFVQYDTERRETRVKTLKMLPVVPTVGIRTRF